MSQLAIALLAWLAVSWFIQSILALAYVRALGRRSGGPTSDTPSSAEAGPRIGVIMPLRGADPFLAEVLTSVLEHDYPRLHLYIVLDRLEDSAADLVAETLKQSRGTQVAVTVEALRDRSPERSLVCSSMIQGFDHLAKTCDLITFCAADTVIPRGWYATIADTMRDPTIGCTLGNRWYLPTEGWWGSLVRQCWNAGAVVLMWQFQIPWSGAASLRPDDVRRSGLRTFWETSLVEDVPIHDAMRGVGQRLQFVPELTNANREEIHWRDAYRFIMRQMIWARLYHPRFPLIVGHALLGLATVVISAGAAGVWLCQGDWISGGAVAAGLVAHLVGLAGLLALLDGAVGSLLASRGEPVAPWSWDRWVRIVLAISLTQIVYPLAILECCLTKQITWRGITYQLLGRGRVRMVEYVPFGSAPSGGKASI